MRLFIVRFWFFIACCFQTFSYTASHCPLEDRCNFQDILLVVHYNHPFYSSRNFIRELYADFPNIVFYGEKVCAEEPNAVIPISTQTGFS